MKIMIIEDDLVIASSLQEELLKWQYSAFYVTDFNDVMNTFTQEAPQLVLIDIKLPYFNGYYWCTEIRKNLSSTHYFCFFTERTNGYCNGGTNGSR